MEAGCEPRDSGPRLTLLPAPWGSPVPQRQRCKWVLPTAKCCGNADEVTFYGIENATLSDCAVLCRLLNGIITITNISWALPRCQIS